MQKKLLLIFCNVLVLVVCVCFLSCSTYNNQSTKVSADTRAIIEFECRGKTYKYTDNILPTPDHTIIDEFEHRKINNSLDQKLKMIDKAINTGATYRQAFEYSFPLLPSFVDKIIAEYNVAPIDSSIQFNPDSRPMFNITREQLGYEINQTRLYQDVYYSLIHTPYPKIKIVPQTLSPKINALDNIKLTSLRSKFTTDFSASNNNRKHNISLALSKINGLVLMPDQEFSFNKTVGRRTLANGFLEANIILDGEYVKGTGGGVCQASTTLYNAALRADMLVTMVSNHSLISSYVPPSFDAMVNSSSSDLRFKNIGKSPVFIKAVATSNSAIVEFFGEQLPYTIGVKSVTISIGQVPNDTVITDIDYKHVPPLTPPGERVRVSYGHAALKSEGYLIYYDLLGREISRKLIRKDMYNSCAGLVAIAP